MFGTELSLQSVLLKVEITRFVKSPNRKDGVVHKAPTFQFLDFNTSVVGTFLNPFCVWMHLGLKKETIGSFTLEIKGKSRTVQKENLASVRLT